MKFIDLDHKDHLIPLGHIKERIGSNYHTKARLLLRETYPTLQFIEELDLPLRKGENIRLDFFIPSKKLAIEVQGEQHFTYSSHFHKTPYNFLVAKKRDDEKQELLELNNITLILFNYNETIDEWRTKIS